jgi:hypothetical protein
MPLSDGASKADQRIDRSVLVLSDSRADRAQ